jgi:hypothetical protein
VEVDLRLAFYSIGVSHFPICSLYFEEHFAPGNAQEPYFIPFLLPYTTVNQSSYPLAWIWTFTPSNKQCHEIFTVKTEELSANDDSSREEELLLLVWSEVEKLRCM